MSQPERPVHRPSQNIERRLAAILSADVKGYSRLMGEDEEATLRTLTSHRKVIDSLIAQHRGRIVGTAGDSVLAEFASVVDAVQCAVVIQTSLKVENTHLPSDRQMEFRIGINLGDVMVEGEQIYGDGVNIAARLEALAEAGGICISGIVHEQIKTKLSLHYDDLGEQEVKNIAEPVCTWRVVMDEAAVALAEQLVLRQTQSGVRSPASPKSRVGTVVLVLVSVLLLGGVVILLSPSLPTFITHRSSFITQEAQPPLLPLPDKPSIVVLPFVNMSEGPKQDYFSDGITEDLTSDLSKISSLFVIARNSAFTYKGKAVKVQDISKELGVRYVLEGSVRRAADQVRVTAQLIVASTGGHLWSERYDRPLKDIFALQDEIVQKIVTALKVNLVREEQERFKRAPTSNLDAYDYFLRGNELVLRFTEESLTQARPLYEQALELDPQYAGAYAALSLIDGTLWYFQWTQDPQVLERAFDLAQKAVALDDSSAIAHRSLGRLYLIKKKHDRAIVEAERAIALDPNNAAGYADLGFFLNWAGRPEETISLIEKAMRLDPHYPPIDLVFLGQAYRLTGRYDEAISTYKKALSRNPDLLSAHAGLAITYSMAGKEKDAQAEVEEILRLNPRYTLESSVQQIWPYKDPALLERDLAALRKAGLK